MIATIVNFDVDNSPVYTLFNKESIVIGFFLRKDGKSYFCEHPYRGWDEICISELKRILMLAAVDFKEREIEEVLDCDGEILGYRCRGLYLNGIGNDFEYHWYATKDLFDKKQWHRCGGRKDCRLWLKGIDVTFNGNKRGGEHDTRNPSK